MEIWTGGIRAENSVSPAATFCILHQPIQFTFLVVQIAAQAVAFAIQFPEFFQKAEFFFFGKILLLQLFFFFGYLAVEVFDLFF